MNGSLELPARSTAPLAMVMIELTQLSMDITWASRPSCLNRPRSRATNGIRWTTLGGDTGAATRTLLPVHLALGTAEALGVDAPPAQETATIPVRRSAARCRT